MKKKTLIVIVAVVAVAAIFSAAAYAWWTDSAASGPNNIATGTASLELGGSLPITASGLIPQETLSDDPNQAVPDTGYNVSYFYVHNNGDAPLHFVGWLADGTQDYAVLGSAVHVKITIAPTVAGGSPWDPAGSLSAAGGPWLVYNGPIGQLYGRALGGTHLTTVGHEPLAAGQYAFYKVVTWLDGPSCDNSSQGKDMSCTLQFSGAQQASDL